MAETIGSLTIEWRGEEFKVKLDLAVKDGLVAAGVAVHDKIKKNIGIQGAVTLRRHNITKEIGERRSSPGEYPRMETRSLRDSIDVVRLAGLAVGIGVLKDTIRIDDEGIKDVNEYALALEFKDPRHGGRPWLLRSFVESRGAAFASFVEETALSLNKQGAGGAIRSVS